MSLTALTIFTAVTMLLTPLLARLFAIDTSGTERSAQLHVLTVFILCFVPQMIFYGFTTLASALLNAHRRFVAAAFVPVLNNVVVIAVLLVFAARTTGRHAAITDACPYPRRPRPAPAARHRHDGGHRRDGARPRPALCGARDIRLRLVFDWRDPALRLILRLSGWTAGYVVTNQIAQLFVLVLAKSGSDGNVSAYVYAFTFYVVPHGLLAVSIMTTMTPEPRAPGAPRDDMPGLRRDFGAGPALHRRARWCRRRCCSRCSRSRCSP